jgi:hypothetical protein
MCPFATNQAMFLSKHVSRHHKSNKLCNWKEIHLALNNICMRF